MEAIAVDYRRGTVLVVLYSVEVVGRAGRVNAPVMTPNGHIDAFPRTMAACLRRSGTMVLANLGSADLRQRTGASCSRQADAARLNRPMRWPACAKRTK